jgi:hypothetical protein
MSWGVKSGRRCTPGLILRPNPDQQIGGATKEGLQACYFQKDWRDMQQLAECSDAKQRQPTI